MDHSPQVYYVGKDTLVRHPDSLWRASCSRCVEHIGQVCVSALTWVTTIGATCCLSSILLCSHLAVAELQPPESHDDNFEFRHRLVDLRGQVFSKRGLELLQQRHKWKDIFKQECKISKQQYYNKYMISDCQGNRWILILLFLHWQKSYCIVLQWFPTYFPRGFPLTCVLNQLSTSQSHPTDQNYLFQMLN